MSEICYGVLLTSCTIATGYWSRCCFPLLYRRIAHEHLFDTGVGERLDYICKSPADSGCYFRFRCKGRSSTTFITARTVKKKFLTSETFSRRTLTRPFTVYGGALKTTAPAPEKSNNSEAGRQISPCFSYLYRVSGYLLFFLANAVHKGFKNFSVYSSFPCTSIVAPHHRQISCSDSLVDISGEAQ